MAPFQPGDVVVCVSTGGIMDDGYCQIGQVYRIAFCEECFDLDGSDVWGVELEGDPDFDDDKLYPAVWFRKIDDEVTEQFREQLRNLPAPAKERTNA